MNIFKKIGNKILYYWFHNIYFIFIRFLLIKITSKRVVIFNRNHPFYTDFFYSGLSQDYVWLYINNQDINHFLVKIILKNAVLLHLDASHFDNKFFGFEKPIVVECEAMSNDEIVEDSRVGAIIYLSNYAQQISEPNNKSFQLYPTFSIAGNYIKPKKDSEAIVLLTSGYGTFRKGYDISYAIYDKLKNDGLNVKLIIAGADGHDFETYPEITREEYKKFEFEKLISKLKSDPNIQFRPFTRNEMIKDIYPKVDVLLHFCRGETFGFSILEAIAFQIPVVSLKFKAIPEMVKHGENGILIDAFNWDGNSVVDERVYNTFEWRDKCIEEGFLASKRIINDYNNFQNKINNMDYNHFSHTYKLMEIEKIYKKVLLEK